MAWQRLSTLVLCMQVQHTCVRTLARKTHTHLCDDPNSVRVCLPLPNDMIEPRVYKQTITQTNKLTARTVGEKVGAAATSAAANNAVYRCPAYLNGVRAWITSRMKQDR